MPEVQVIFYDLDGALVREVKTGPVYHRLSGEGWKAFQDLARLRHEATPISVERAVQTLQEIWKYSHSENLSFVQAKQKLYELDLTDLAPQP